jgi:hypothetical protein
MSEDGGSIRVTLQLSEEEAHALLRADLAVGGGERTAHLASVVLGKVCGAALQGLAKYRLETGGEDR